MEDIELRPRASYKQERKKRPELAKRRKPTGSRAPLLKSLNAENLVAMPGHAVSSLSAHTHERGLPAKHPQLKGGKESISFYSLLPSLFRALLIGEKLCHCALKFLFFFFSFFIWSYSLTAASEVCARRGGGGLLEHHFRICRSPVQESKM